MPRLLTPLVPITVASIYKSGSLPARMAKCTPDTTAAIQGVVADLRALGYDLRLSDLFRSYAMQKKAHEDYVEGGKKAYSPPPGGSMHEAGRAMDIELASIGVPLKKFWEIARARAFLPIIDKPDPSRSEAWHFDCRGSHHMVYEYTRKGKAGVSMAPYTQMAHSAILAIGVKVDTLPDQGIGSVQAGLIRLGLDPGRIDGILGARTTAALQAAGFDGGDAVGFVSAKLKEKFPLEF